MNEVMTGEMSNVRMAAALAALRVRGETPDEIAGFAQAMRRNAVRVDVRPREVLLDIVGTGGDGAHTFNISTTAAFVIAGAGVDVAKHGNRAASSKAGASERGWSSGSTGPGAASLPRPPRSMGRMPRRRHPRMSMATSRAAGAPSSTAVAGAGAATPEGRPVRPSSWRARAACSKATTKS